MRNVKQGLTVCNSTVQEFTVEGMRISTRGRDACCFSEKETISQSELIKGMTLCNKELYVLYTLITIKARCSESWFVCFVRVRGRVVCSKGSIPEGNFTCVSRGREMYSMVGA